jgi:hypothetical protein
MFWAFKLSFVVDSFGLFLTWQLFGLFLKNLGIFFSNLLVTLPGMTNLLVVDVDVAVEVSF